MYGKIARLLLYQKHHCPFSSMPFSTKICHDFHQSLLTIINQFLQKTEFSSKNRFYLKKVFFLFGDHFVSVRDDRIVYSLCYLDQMIIDKWIILHKRFKVFSSLENCSQSLCNNDEKIQVTDIALNFKYSM
jgi:hypothetical protein